LPGEAARRGRGSGQLAVGKKQLNTQYPTLNTEHPREEERRLEHALSAISRQLVAGGGTAMTPRRREEWFSGEKPWQE